MLGRELRGSCGSCPACWNWAEFPSGTDSVQHTDLVAMSSLLTPCRQKPLCAGDCSLVTATCILHPLQDRGQGTRNWYHHLNHCSRGLHLCVGVCDLCEEWKSHRDWGGWVELSAFERFMGTLNAGRLCLAVFKVFYLRITLPPPKECLFKQEN